MEDPKNGGMEMGDPISPQNTLFLPLFDHFFWGGGGNCTNSTKLTYNQLYPKLQQIICYTNYNKFYQILPIFYQTIYQFY